MKSMWCNVGLLCFLVSLKCLDISREKVLYILNKQTQSMKQRKNPPTGSFQTCYWRPSLYLSFKFIQFYDQDMGPENLIIHILILSDISLFGGKHVTCKNFEILNDCIEYMCLWLTQFFMALDTVLDVNTDTYNHESTTNFV